MYVTTYVRAAFFRPYLSAIDPTTVPKIIEDPKPAMKSFPMSPRAVTIVLIERVNVGALQPVARHHERVDEEISVTEGDKILGHSDAFLDAHLLHLQRGASDGDEPELNPVVALRTSGRGGAIVKRWVRLGFPDVKGTSLGEADGCVWGRDAPPSLRATDANATGADR